MYAGESIKEDTKNLKISLCCGCLSFDRKLKPLGEKKNIFCMLVNDTYSKFSDVLLCWECMAVLRKVKLFKEKVDHAQRVLSKSFHLLNSESILPEPLSTLAYKKIDIDTNNTIISPINCYNEWDLEIKEENEETIEPEVPVEAIQSNCLAESFSSDLDNDNIDQIQDSVSENINIDQILDSVSENSVDSLALNENLVKRRADAKRKLYAAVEDPDYIPEETLLKEQKKNLKHSNADDENIAGPKIKKHKRNSYTYILKDDDISQNIKKVTVDTAELLACMEKDRNSELFRNIKNKCEKCVLPIPNYRVEEHKSLHIKKGLRQLSCHVCEQTFKTKQATYTHMPRHKYLHQCVVCNSRISTMALMKRHLKSHALQVQCNDCKLVLPSRLAFFQHQRDVHSKFICDYCGHSRTSKSKLILHISKHIGTYCEKCKKLFKNYNEHVNLYHTTKNVEEAFCVECNIQFRNVNSYKQHLHSSRAHNPEKRERAKQERHECPDCHKVYSTKFALKDHHDYVHKGESRYKCAHCNRQFLSSCRLKCHIERVHLKLKPEKNKICNFCCRGFLTNKILRHHIRTHTGERPHHCPHCDASFAQKVAMKSHIKNIHLKTASGVFY